MGRIKIAYEWVVEDRDPTDHDEIVDCQHFPTLAEAMAHAETVACPVVGLLKHYGEVFAGSDRIDDEVGRAYAYVVDGELEEEFDDETPVPIKFRKQVAA